MDPVTLRRLLVFGVCAVGVGCLYVLPNSARVPHQGAGQRPHTEPTVSPASATTTPTPRPSAVPADASSSPAPTASATAGPAVDRAGDAPASTVPPFRPPSRQATPSGPTDGDDQPPAPVTDVRSAALTREKLSLRWPAAEDNVGVTGYRVLLNGYPVAATPLTHTTVRWFNDDASEQVVQVRALDAAGNVGPASPPLLLARPTPAPTSSDSPGPTAQPVPTTTVTPQPTPDTPSPRPGLRAGLGDPSQGQEPTVNQTPSLEPSAAGRGQH